MHCGPVARTVHVRSMVLREPRRNTFTESRLSMMQKLSGSASLSICSCVLLQYNARQMCSSTCLSRRCIWPHDKSLASCSRQLTLLRRLRLMSATPTACCCRCRRCFSCCRCCHQAARHPNHQLLRLRCCTAPGAAGRTCKQAQPMIDHGAIGIGCTIHVVKNARQAGPHRRLARPCRRRCLCGCTGCLAVKLAGLMACKRHAGMRCRQQALQGICNMSAAECCICMVRHCPLTDAAVVA